MAHFPYRKRLAQVKAHLRNAAPSALLLTSAPHKARNRDTSFVYRQDSDFYYLTGVLDSGYALLVSSELPRPLLISTPVDPIRVLWDGPMPSLKKLAAAIGADPVTAKDIKGELRSNLRGIELLYYQNTPGTAGFELAAELFDMSSHKRGNLPLRFAHVDAILAEMRMIKDRSEIEAIRLSARITNAALFGALSLIQPGALESEIAGVIEFYFRSYGAVPSFNSIVASGASAATLHHERLTGKLKNGDLLLLDVGAENDLYAGDITRVLPVSGRFDPIQKRIYEVVLRAQKAAIKKVRSGITMNAVHEAAAAEMVDGLLDLGVLKGKSRHLLKEHKYKPYFPHSIGHLLGIDVHDIGRAIPKGPLVLRPGMVVTIEPGLYFPKKLGKVPACGIRIEDDVLVTKGAPEILSEGFPKEIDEVEALFE